jgi:hypothetical protein
MIIEMVLREIGDLDLDRWMIIEMVLREIGV